MVLLLQLSLTAWNRKTNVEYRLRPQLFEIDFVVLVLLHYGRLQFLDTQRVSLGFASDVGNVLAVNPLGIVGSSEKTRTLSRLRSMVATFP